MRDAIGIVVQVPCLHGPVLAVVADDDQDRQIVSLRGAQRLDHRVVEERAVADECRDRPIAGVRLGAGNRPVAALIGDGSFLYNPVVQALGASKGNGLPVLIVVCNNQQYRAMQTGHLHHYPDGVAQEADIWHGVPIDGPDYSELGKAFGLPGQKVERPAELPGAIRNAMREVESGKTAILNVMLSR